MDLKEFNSLDIASAIALITQCCAAHRWVEAVVAGRPYSDWQQLVDHADASWLDMQEDDFLEAFSAHPQIGNVETLRAKFANTKALASGEQGLVQQADETTLNSLASGNQQYLDKFGFIFIVCATGKSAAEMLALLEARLPNTRAQELENAAFEQHKITVIRLQKLFDEPTKA